MAFVNICGFETGDLSEAIASSGSVSIQTTIKRTGAYALRVNPAGAIAYIQFRKHGADGADTPIGLATGYLTAYIRFTSFPSATSEVLYIGSGGGRTCGARVSSGGVVTIWNGTTDSPTIATLSTGVFYRLELKAVNGGTCEGKIDGGTVQTITGGAFDFDTFYLGNPVAAATMDMYFDDVAVKDDGYAGAGEVHILKPNATGTDTAWADGAGTAPTNVAEVPHDSDTGYISSTTTGEAETENLDSAATGGVLGPIGAVKACAIVRDEGGASAIQLRLRSGTTTDDTTSRDPGATYILSAKMFSTDPNTAAAWTESGLDAMQVGVDNAASVAVRCTALYAMVWSVGSVDVTLLAAAATATAFSPASTMLTISFLNAEAALAAALSPASIFSGGAMFLAALAGGAALAPAAVFVAEDNHFVKQRRGMFVVRGPNSA